MKKALLLLTLLYISLAGRSQCADPANIYQFEYNEKSYQVVKEELNWADAAACANELGGYLVEINNQQEQEAILDSILNGAGVATDYVAIFNGGDIAYVWTGATDQSDEGQWIWDGNNNNEGDLFWSGQGANGDNDGAIENTAYVNWGGSGAGTIMEPDDYGSQGQDYAAIGLTGWPSGTTALGDAGEWNDIIGTSEIYFVVEYDLLLSNGGTNRISPESNRSDAQFIRLYPNPASDILFLDAGNLTLGDIRSIDIYSITGSLIQSTPETPISLEGYESGMYMVRVTTSSRVFLEKILIR